MKLSYQVTVPPPGTEKSLPPVILLHGRMDSKKTWKHIALEIARKTGRKVFCYDARNHGESPWNDDMNFEVMTNDLEEFLAQQGIGRAILLGHSLGGRTSMTFALRKPEIVEKLIVEDMVATNYPSIAKQSVQYFMNVLRESLSAIPPQADEKTAKEAILEFIKSQLPPAVGERKQSTLFDLDTMPIRREGSSYRWQANLDVLEEMLNSEKNSQTLTGLYNGDSLFLYGTESFFDVPGDESIHILFPRSIKLAIERAGHLIHQDYPEEFCHHVIKFINSDTISSTL